MRSSDEQTALMIAAAKNHSQFVWLLAPMEHSLIDKEGKAAIHYAAAGDCYESMQQLVSFELFAADN